MAQDSIIAKKLSVSIAQMPPFALQVEQIGHTP